MEPFVVLSAGHCGPLIFIANFAVIMKHLFRLTFLLSLFGFTVHPYAAAQSPSAAPDTLRLSREECVRIGMEKSPTVKVADLEVRKSDYSRRETLAQLFPQINFQLAYQRSIELQTIQMDMGGTSQQFKMGSDNSWNTGFSASLPIIAPTLWKSISISDTQILHNLELARASRIDLECQVSKAYYALQLAIDSREVLRQQFEISKFNAEIYSRQYEQGTASEYDVLRSSVQVKNLEPELLQADIAVRQCQLQLTVLTGLSAEVVIMPDTDLEQLHSQMHPVEERQTDLSGNSSLRQLDLQARMAAQTTALRKLAFLPTLGASFNINWSALSNGNPFSHQHFFPYSNVGFSLSFPIFTGGSRYNALRQAKVNQAELSLQRENLVNSLNMQVELALDNINRHAAQINSSSEGVEQARKANQIMQKSFEIGAASYLELRDSELALTSSRLMYLQAIHNYMAARADLQALMGE